MFTIFLLFKLRLISLIIMCIEYFKRKYQNKRHYFDKILASSLLQEKNKDNLWNMLTFNYFKVSQILISISFEVAINIFRSFLEVRIIQIADLYASFISL